MGCVHSGKNVGILRRPIDTTDLQTKKRQSLIEYALRQKIHSILDITSSKMPF